MSDLNAKIAALTSVVLVAIAGIALFLTSGAGLQGTEVRAEFENAFPLLPGMNVRVDGAVAGTVKDIQLTDRGTALVTMVLNQGTQPPTSDATAAVRQQDITGDSYVSLGLGNASDPLGAQTIPPSRTLVAPRLDDLLNAFDSPTRQGLKLILVESGIALENNGDDLNAAELALRPALEQTSQALQEVNSQNQALRQLVVDAENVTGQAASRSRELGSLVDSLTLTLDTTAAHAPALDRALAVAPRTVGAARTTLSRLINLAYSAQPLAQSLASGAPQLSQSLDLLGPFLDDTHATLNDVQPTLALTNSLLVQARPTLEASTRRTLTAPFDLAAGLGKFFKAVLANKNVLNSLFGADSYGKLPGAANDHGLGATAVEAGNLSGYETSDPQQRFLRAVAVPSCQIFGLPITPGCLAKAAASGKRGHEGHPSGRGAPQVVAPTPAPAQPEQPHPAPDQPNQGTPNPGGPLPLPNLPHLPRLPLPDIPGVSQDGHLHLQGNGPITDLLNFLLGSGS